jgi:hypothetical protein
MVMVMDYKDWMHYAMVNLLQSIQSVSVIHQDRDRIVGIGQIDEVEFLHFGYFC